MCRLVTLVPSLFIDTWCHLHAGLTWLSQDVLCAVQTHHSGCHNGQVLVWPLL